MTSNIDTSRFIVEVERAVCDLRRGLEVEFIPASGTTLRIAAAETAESSADDETLKNSSHPAIRLLKYARLLPVAWVRQGSGAENSSPLLAVSEAAILAYPQALATSLKRVSSAHVPLSLAEDAEVIAFRPRYGHEEHLAVIIGALTAETVPLVRLHSSCVTGDMFGSLRCDCGPQLASALAMMAEAGGGVLLYLSQEGRGIGIANKLRAYNLQDDGMDTVEANEALGYAPDERDFGVAAAMLRALGISRVHLLTNNPAKITALEQYGITVADRRPLQMEANSHNRFYLDTKARKMGHFLERPE